MPAGDHPSRYAGEPSQEGLEFTAAPSADQEMQMVAGIGKLVDAHRVTVRERSQCEAEGAARCVDAVATTSPCARVDRSTT